MVWPVVQLDYDKEEEPWYAINGSTFILARASLIGLATIHTDNLDIIAVWWRKEEGCIGPTQKDVDLWVQCWKWFRECG